MVVGCKEAVQSGQGFEGDYGVEDGKVAGGGHGRSVEDHRGMEGDPLTTIYASGFWCGGSCGISGSFAGWLILAVRIR